ncbi:MAG: Rrf2 family transcriptional regulator [Nevskia sp.]|nr:Rrf2 family transcriptional regulator [Nevskia sp.]
MAHLGNGVEYGLHCLLWLAGAQAAPVSSRDLADLQGVPAAFLAKIFPKLEKAGIVAASEGIRGGYRLARAPERVTVLDVVDAIEGEKPLFDCREIRGRCAVFGGKPPAWSTGGVCAIHAVMLRAEQGMRRELARTTLADLAKSVSAKAPAEFAVELQGWLAGRASLRLQSRTAPVKDARAHRRRRGAG